MSQSQSTSTGYLDLLKAVRDPNRPRASGMLPGLVDGFQPIASPDPALIIGEGELGGQRVCVFAQEKPAGRRARAALAVNYGMMRTSGYAHVARLVRAMAKQADPPALLTLIDTPGADPSHQGDGMLARAISACIAAFATYPSPTLSVIIGEGGSGGALALQVADYRAMVSDAMYSVISPESCSAILFRSPSEIEKSMKLLQPSATDALASKAIDEIVDWPSEDPGRVARLRTLLAERLARLSDLERDARVRDRTKRIMACGEIPDAAAAWTRAAPPPSEDAPVLPVRFTTERGGPGTARLRCARADGGCDATFTQDAFITAGWACPECGRGERISAAHWLSLIVDKGSFDERYRGVDVSDLSTTYDTPMYRSARADARMEGASESLRTGIATIEGVRCAVAVSDFRFFGGTMGVVVGEKLRRMCTVARLERLPVVTVVCSGGARLQEGTLGLMQMAKTTIAVREVSDAGLPVICILADPCTGGALASYATSGTVTLAEPHALIAFAGPRVMKLGGFRIDEKFLDSNFLAETGHIDEVVPRARMRRRIARYLALSRTAGDERVALLRETSLDAQVTIRRRISDLVEHIAATVVEDRWDAQPHIAAEAMRSTAVSSLADLALVTIPSLIAEAAQDSNPRVRSAALEALARFPRLEGDGLLELALTDSHHRVRANAAIELLRTDAGHRGALEAVRDLLSHEQSTVRRAGLFVAMRVPVHQEQARLIALAASDEPRERMLAAVALVNIGMVDISMSVFDAARISVETESLSYLARLIRFVPDPVRAKVEALIKRR